MPGTVEIKVKNRKVIWKLFEPESMIWQKSKDDCEVLSLGTGLDRDAISQKEKKKNQRKSK